MLFRRHYSTIRRIYLGWCSLCSLHTVRHCRAQGLYMEITSMEACTSMLHVMLFTKYSNWFGAVPHWDSISASPVVGFQTIMWCAIIMWWCDFSQFSCRTYSQTINSYGLQVCMQSTLVPSIFWHRFKFHHPVLVIFTRKSCCRWEPAMFQCCYKFCSTSDSGPRCSGTLELKIKSLEFWCST